MKYSMSALALTLASRALADTTQTIKLYIKSDNPELNGKGIAYKSEIGRQLYFFATDAANTQEFSGTQSAEGYSWTLYTSESDSLSVNYNVLNTFEPKSVTGFFIDDDGVVSADSPNDDLFYACKNVHDVKDATGNSYDINNYSAVDYEIFYYTAPNDSCVEIKLVNYEPGASSSSSSSAPSSSQAVTTSSAPASYSTTFSSSSVQITSSTFSNTTLTTHTNTDGSTVTESVSCHRCSVSTYEAAADIERPVFGAVALAAGVAALLI